MVKISILMLAKNSGKTLWQAASSVLYNNDVELIIIEPGSQDNSRAIAFQIQEQFLGRVKIVTTKDTSPAEGLNNGLKEVTGEIIGVLNADDLYLPNALEYVGKFFLQNPVTDILLGSGLIVDETRNSCKYVYTSWVNTTTLKYSKIGAFTFFHQGMFFRKSIASGITFNAENRVNWDFEFLTKLYERKPIISHTSNKLAIFRIHPGSITYTRNQAGNRQQFSEFNYLQLLCASMYRIAKAIHSTLLTLRAEVFMNRFQKR